MQSLETCSCLHDHLVSIRFISHNTTTILEPSIIKNIHGACSKIGEHGDGDFPNNVNASPRHIEHVVLLYFHLKVCFTYLDSYSGSLSGICS